MCCNLSDINQDLRSPIGNPHLSNSQQQVLAGTLVSSLHRLKDIDNTGGSKLDCMSGRDAKILISDGGFFVFGDVSVKIEGEYRLRFSLFEMVRERQEVMYIKSVMSEPFTGEPKAWSVVYECWLKGTLQCIHLEASRAWMSPHSCHDLLETREFGWESGKSHERCCECSLITGSSAFCHSLTWLQETTSSVGFETGRLSSGLCAATTAFGKPRHAPSGTQLDQSRYSLTTSRHE